MSDLVIKFSPRQIRALLLFATISIGAPTLAIADPVAPDMCEPYSYGSIVSAVAQLKDTIQAARAELDEANKAKAKGDTVKMKTYAFEAFSALLVASSDEYIVGPEPTIDGNGCYDLPNSPKCYVGKRCYLSSVVKTVDMLEILSAKNWPNSGMNSDRIDPDGVLGYYYVAKENDTTFLQVVAKERKKSIDTELELIQSALEKHHKELLTLVPSSAGTEISHLVAPTGRREPAPLTDKEANSILAAAPNSIEQLESVEKKLVGIIAMLNFSEVAMSDPDPAVKPGIEKQKAEEVARREREEKAMEELERNQAEIAKNAVKGAELERNQAEIAKNAVKGAEMRKQALAELEKFCAMKEIKELDSSMRKSMGCPD